MVEQHLQRRLEDAVTAWRADPEYKLVLACDDARRHRHVPSLVPTAHEVRARRLEIGPVEEVVQHDAGVTRDEAAAKWRSVALRHSDQVAPAVGNLEVRRVLRGTRTSRLQQAILVLDETLTFTRRGAAWHRSTAGVRRHTRR